MGGEKPVEVKIVGFEGDIKVLIDKLSILIDNFNKFFETAFTSGGRLKVATIPIPVGITGEAMESIEKLPDLVEKLIEEIQKLRDEMAKVSGKMGKV